MDDKHFLQRRTLTAALLAFFSALVLSPGVLASDRPNVVILFADDMNYAGPSCYGGRWGLETPHIDRLAKEGVRCTDAYVSAPTCGPSRAGLITGRHQCRFGHEFNSPRKEGIGLPLTEETIGDRMRALGYHTGLIGKWHLGGDETCGADYHPLKRGFDEFFGFYGSMVWFYRSNHIFRGTEQVKDPGYLTDVLARESCDFIRRHRERPFLLYTAFNAVHTPLEATEEDFAAVSRLDFSAFQNQEKAKTRAAMLLALDRAVGLIMETLKTEGLDENTFVIFTNDNGDYNGNGPFSGGKGQVSEGGIRVPFLLRWKGRLPAGVDYGEMVSTLDILPTAVVAGGGKIDADWKLDGVDLTEYLAGNKQGRPHERLYWRIGQERAIREGPWKIRFNGGSGYGYKPKPGEAHWALYNVENDPGERHDLKEQEPARFSELKDQYDRWNQQLHKPRWSFGASGQMERW
jgi:arylsulfatase A-like enzyme